METSIGLDRTFLAVLSHAYREEKLEDGSERVVLGIPARLAPVKVAVLPLIKKDGLPEKAREIMDTLKYDYRCFYEEKDTIGRRYRRMDALGTPYRHHHRPPDPARTIPSPSATGIPCCRSGSRWTGYGMSSPHACRGYSSCKGDS